MTRPMRDQLFAAKGCGSVIVEMACALAHMPIDLIEVEWTKEGIRDPRLFAVNPLQQVPTYVRRNGEVLTESAAIVLYLADLYPQGELAPHFEHRDRARFLRWLMFLNAATYPTFTYGDFATHWAGEEGAARLKETTMERRKETYMMVESQLERPFFLGRGMSAIDLYLCAMRCWGPGKAWFDTHCPKISTAAKLVSQNVILRAVLERNDMSD
jgi:GST-like protein